MIDIRDAEAMVIRLRDAQGRFEKGAPVPYAVRALLDELVDALADSGPFELDVTSAAWLSSVRSAERGIAAAVDGSSPKAVRRAKRSIRELKGFFGENDWTWIGCIFVLFLLPVLVPLVAFGLFEAVCMAIVMSPFFLLWLLVKWLINRYIPSTRAAKVKPPDVREVASGLELPDRLLFALEVNVPRPGVNSAGRARSRACVSRPVEKCPTCAG